MSTILQANIIVHNRYRIVRLIGKGGMGAVYEAIDQTFGSTVALKQMFPNPSLTTVNTLTGAFKREAKILNNLRHPALPKVSDYFIDAEHGHFLVMDHVQGDDLSDILDKHMQTHGTPLTEQEIIPWMIQVLEALDYLHHQSPPVIHRDIKPHNIKVTPDGAVFLLDFGISKGVSIHATTTIQAFTPAYSPLEQIEGTGTDARGDLFSLGATMYQMLTGNSLSECHALARANALVLGQPDPLQPPPGVSKRVSKVLMQALSMRPDQRPESAKAMIEALQPLPLPPPPPPTIRTTLKPRPFPWVAVLAVLMIVVGLVGVLGMWLVGGGVDLSSATNLIVAYWGWFLGVIIGIILLNFRVAVWWFLQKHLLQIAPFSNMTTQHQQQVDSRTLRGTGKANSTTILLSKPSSNMTTQQVDSRTLRGTGKANSTTILPSKEETSSPKPNTMLRIKQPTVIDVSQESVIIEELILHQDYEYIWKAIAHLEKGKFLLTGYGPFGGTSLIHCAIEKARKAIQENQTTSGAFLVFYFRLSEEDGSFKIEANKFSFGYLKLHIDQDDEVTLSGLEAHAKPVPSTTSSLKRLDFGLEKPLQYSFIGRGTQRRPIFGENKATYNLGQFTADLQRFLEHRQDNTVLQQIITNLTQSEDFPSRVVFVIDKIRQLQTLESLIASGLFDNPRTLVLAISPKEDFDQWHNSLRLLKDKGFQEWYLTCLWKRELDALLFEAIPNRDPVVEDQWKMVSKHLEFVGRGSLGYILEELRDPKNLRYENDQRLIDVSQLTKRHEVKHNAWLQDLLELNWKAILDNNFAGRYQTQLQDRARLGIYHLLDWIAERSSTGHSWFTPDQIKTEAHNPTQNPQRTTITISKDPTLITNVVENLLSVLTEAKYLKEDKRVYRVIWNEQTKQPSTSYKYQQQQQLEEIHIREQEDNAKLDRNNAYVVARAGKLQDAILTLERIRGRLLSQRTSRGDDKWDTIANAVAVECPLVYLLTTDEGSMTLIVHRQPLRDDVTKMSIETTEFTGKVLNRLLGTGENNVISCNYIYGQLGNRQYLDTALAAMPATIGTHLLAPLAQALRDIGATQVVLIPTGRLGVLPLHTIPYDNNGMCLIDTYAVTYAPSAQVLTTIRQEATERHRRTPQHHFVGIGNPLPSHAPLSFATAEVKSIATMLPDTQTTTFYEHDATADALWREVKEATIAHLSCHGTFNLADPLNSALALAEGSQITLGDILQAEKTALTNIQLAVLSACQTAVTDVRTIPDEMVGLFSGFVQAGIPAVVGTLWSVNAASTALLLIRFYEHYLQEAMHPSEALRQAQGWLRTLTYRTLKDYLPRPFVSDIIRAALQAVTEGAIAAECGDERLYADPRYWAGFVYYGAPGV